MEEKISIIVPVYNVEKYVERSIRSAMKQTYKNVEILVVDDGSTDNSLEICKRLAQEDDRIKIYHKENGGQGSARNIALNNASGEYICFLDSDDYLKVDYVEFLYRLLKDNNLDIAVCNYELYSETGNLLRKRIAGNGYLELSGIDAIYSMWTQGIVNIGPWVKLYKKDLWSRVRFKECFGEDFATMHFIFIQADKVGYSYECKLNYLVRGESSIRKFQENKIDLIHIAESNINFAKNCSVLMPAAKQKAASVYFHVLFQLPNERKYDILRKKIESNIRKIRFDVLKDKKCIKKTRVALLLSYLSFDMTKKLFLTLKRNDVTF